MATTIKLKNSVTTTNAPSSLVQGEVAINITDKKVWVGNAATTPIQLLGDGGSASFTSIAFGAGTVSNPSITFTGDTNTGIYSPAADTIAFTEGGVESMRIDSSGNVGIGTSSPTGKLTFGQTASGNTKINGDRTDAQFTITGGSGSSGGIIQLFGSTYTNYAGAIYLDAVSSTSGTNDSCIIFRNGSSPTERMRITSGGRVCIGTTEANRILNVYESESTANSSTSFWNLQYGGIAIRNTSDTANTLAGISLLGGSSGNSASGIANIQESSTLGALGFYTGGSGRSNTVPERMRISSGGDVMVAKTTLGSSTVGCELRASGLGVFTASAPGSGVVIINRNTDDGTLIDFRQDNTLEGTITVSGSTVSYNGGHLSRWSQLPSNQKDNTLLKGTVMSNLDDMCVWTKDGEVLPNEQLNKMKVSDVEGDTNVAGVFVNWTRDEDCNSDDMNVAMTGDMIIRIAQGVVVQKGDLLMSAGDGTAKPQGDDIRRSKTVAKVTSNHVTCTYADGSYCVPCVLMAC